MVKTIVLISSATGSQSGKSIIASWLALQKESCPYVLSFAEPIKKMLISLMKSLVPTVTEEDLDHWFRGSGKNDVLETIGVTPRRLMQTLGTEWRNMVDSTLWHKIMKASLDKAIQGYPHKQMFIIDDLRYVEEYNAIKQWAAESGNKVFHIRVNRSDNQVTDTHDSEQVRFVAEDIDMHLYNSDSYSGLVAKMPSVLDHILT